jgi:hypothetical protein
VLWSSIFFHISGCVLFCASFDKDSSIIAFYCIDSHIAASKKPFRGLEHWVGVAAFWECLGIQSASPEGNHKCLNGSFCLSNSSAKRLGLNSKRNIDQKFIISRVTEWACGDGVEPVIMKGKSYLWSFNYATFASEFAKTQSGDFWMRVSKRRLPNRWSREREKGR